MKQLTCEMCGSTDLAKQDGFIVCRGCGMKYSVEEAKKLMVESTATAQGNSRTKSTDSVENLLTLAHSSFDSKNYAQAENFCNQVIAADKSIYEAWKLKGEAINYQINVDNPRILEVYNCIMTSYDVLDDSGKEEHRDEILDSLKICLEGEIDFWLEQFEAKRPTDDMLQKVKTTFIDCASKTITSIKQLGYSEEDAEEYKADIKKHFVEKAVEVCKQSWKSIVYYNYKQDKHDDDEIFKTFLTEGDNLVSLLTFVEDFIDDPLNKIQFEIYDTIITIHSKIIDADRERFATIRLSLDAKEARKKIISIYEDTKNKLKNALAKSSPEDKQKLINEYKKKIEEINNLKKPKIGCATPLFTLPALALILIPLIICFSEGDEILSIFESFGSGFCVIFGVILLFITVFCIYAVYDDKKSTYAYKMKQKKQFEEELQDIINY